MHMLLPLGLSGQAAGFVSTAPLAFCPCQTLLHDQGQFLRINALQSRGERRGRRPPRALQMQVLVEPAATQPYPVRRSTKFGFSSQLGKQDEGEQQGKGVANATLTTTIGHLLILFHGEDDRLA